MRRQSDGKVRRSPEEWERILEREITEKGLDDAATQKRRGSRSRPIVAEFFEWLERELAASVLLPTNPFTKAAHYSLDRQAGLEVYLSNPEVPIDTNPFDRVDELTPRLWKQHFGDDPLRSAIHRDPPA